MVDVIGESVYGVVIILMECSCLQIVACSIESRQEHVYMWIHALHVEHLSVQSHVSLTSLNVYLMLPSLADGTLQVTSSTTSYCRSEFAASLCRLLICDTLCEYFPFSNFSVVRRLYLLRFLEGHEARTQFFCFVCVVSKVLWNDSRKILVFARDPLRKYDAHSLSRLQ